MKTTVIVHHTSFHQVNLASIPPESEVQKQVFTFAANSLEGAGDFAFEVTNNPNIDKSDYLVHADKRSHSASVGDIVEWDGKFALIDGFGFFEITKKEFDQVIALVKVHPKSEDETLCGSYLKDYLVALRPFKP